MPLRNHSLSGNSPIYTRLKKNFHFSLTQSHSRPTITSMSDDTTRLNKLEQQVGDLLGFCEKLSNENKDLRTQINQLSRDRSALVEQKESARTQVESMITRLRLMENA